MAEIISPTSWRVGDVRLDLLDEGALRLDGGAMFRVVPRVLWERAAAPDAQHRVRLAMRPLLVRSGGQTLLVDAGIGPERRDASFRERAGIEPGQGVEAGLAALGLGPDDVDRVVLTHLHFDHAGGLVRDDGAQVRPRFPNASVVVQRRELEDAGEDCGLCRASYVADDYRPLADAERLEVIDGDRELAPGVRVEVTGGHTRAHQIVRIQSGGETAVFWGDLIPTAAHLRPHYVMAFDLYPRQSWEAKARLLPRAIEEGWIHVLYHEPTTPLGRVVASGRDYRVEPLA